MSARSVPAYYWSSVSDFISTDSSSVLGQLASANSFTLDQEQRDAWTQEVQILRTALSGVAGTLFLEFDIPRLGSRVDAVLLSGPAIFPIEFKCGETRFKRVDFNQAWDYALDLKNFHKASHLAPVLPILVATEAKDGDNVWRPAHPDGVRPPYRCCASNLGQVIRSGLLTVDGLGIDGSAWGSAPYEPTPTIIEAARSLYARHTVEAISRHDAGAKNLKITSVAVEEIIERSRARQEKSIVFLTGVPGAGKTLVGLNVATQRREFGDARAVFLSGNGPLVAVLQEALTRDEMARQKQRTRKGVIFQQVKPFIQNVHHFRDEGIRTSGAPFDHVVIFDEAQRAWDRQKTADFMKRRKKILGFRDSEPEFLISYLDRHSDWAVIVCLVGGGQEIHTGEAGIGEWFNAASTRFQHWRIYVSPEITDSEYSSATAFDPRVDGSCLDSRLHLASSMRSFRSEHVSGFVKALLDCDVPRAKGLLAEVSHRYPIAVTRDLARAKSWVKHHARGSERFGLVASSQAQRLKPHAIDVRIDIDPVHWFLDSPEDTRSSYYLEDAATEFQIQGLELDWICMTWDADLRTARGGWEYHEFRGKKWNSIRKPERQRYLLNAYRVLLTRARQGFVVFVPPGDADDPTRVPGVYDRTYEYLRGIGLAEA